MSHLSNQRFQSLSSPVSPYTPLVPNVSHQQLIVDALTSLEDKNEFDEMLHETASDVSKTLSMAVEILANLMTFNKIETGIMTLHKQDINVKQYIHDVRNSFAAEAREKGTYEYSYVDINKIFRNH